MKSIQVLNFIITLVLFSLFSYELILIIKKFQRDSFQFINEHVFEEILPPVITFCPAPAYKKTAPFLSQQEFMENKFTWEEIFHPVTLGKIRNREFYYTKETYAAYYGICFTVQKRTPEKISDFSFQFALNSSIGKFFTSIEATLKAKSKGFFDIIFKSH